MQQYFRSYRVSGWVSHWDISIQTFHSKQDKSPIAEHFFVENPLGLFEGHGLYKELNTTKHRTDLLEMKILHFKKN